MKKSRMIKRLWVGILSLSLVLSTFSLPVSTLLVHAEEGGEQIVQEEDIVINNDDIENEDNADNEDSDAVVDEDDADNEESDAVVDEDDADSEDSDEVVDEDDADREDSYEVVDEDDADSEDSDTVVDEDDADSDDSDAVVDEDNADSDDLTAEVEEEIPVDISINDSKFTAGLVEDSEPVLLSRGVNSNNGPVWTIGYYNPSDVVATLDSEYGIMYISGNGKIAENCDFTGLDTSMVKTLVVYEGVEYLPGILQNDRTFIMNSQIKDVENIILFNDIKKIYTHTFENCSNLKKVYLPNSVEVIGEEAFRYCDNLVYIDFPKNLKKIERKAFVGCPKLTDIELYDGLEEIGAEAFSGAGGMYAEPCCINIPSSIKKVDYGAFSNFYGDVRISLSERFTVISGHIPNNPYNDLVLSDTAFRGCMGRVKIDYDNNIIADNLKTLLTNQDNTHFDIYLSENCTSITPASFPDNLMFALYIKTRNTHFTASSNYNWSTNGYNIFVPQENLDYYQDEISRTNLSPNLLLATDFESNWNDRSPGVYYSDGRYYTWEAAKIQGIVAYESDGYSYKNVRKGNSWPTQQFYVRLVLEETAAVSFAPNGFENCNNLKEIVLSSKQDFHVDRQAFKNCNYLKIKLTDNETLLGRDVFHNAFEGTKIEPYKYYGVKNEIPGLYIDGVFCSFSEARTRGIVVVDDSTPYDVSYSKGNNWPQHNSIKIVFGDPNCAEYTNLEEYLNQESHRKVIINAHGFENCTNLTEIVIPESNYSIGEEAFRNCANLNNLYVLSKRYKDNYTQLLGRFGYNAFEGNNVVEITNENDTVLYASGRIFGYESKLGGLSAIQVIPIGYYHPDEATATINIETGEMTIDGGGPVDLHPIESFISNIKTLTISNGVNIPEIPSYFFSNAENLESVTLPLNLQTIGFGAFMGCEKLKEIIIPEHVTNIGEYAFWGCTALEKIEIKNFDCIIYDSTHTISENTVIYGAHNAKAKEYAEKYNRTYSDTDSPIFITVDSCDKSGNTVAAHLTGSGQYWKGDEVTLYAPKAEGYNFMGWYKKSNTAPYYTGNVLCSTNTYTFTNNYSDTTSLIAVYEPLGSVNITISCSGVYTINGEPKSSEISKSYVLGSEITVATNSADFAYWKNSYGKILSRSNSYTFTATSADTITAVFNTVLANRATLIFESLYDQVIARDQLGLDGTMIIPNVPFNNGYNPLGWDMNGDGIFNFETDTLNAAISRGLQSENMTAIIYPVYELKNNTYTVTVIGGSGSGTYRQNDVVRIVLDESSIPAGKKFSHWVDANSEIRSYSRNMSFYAERNEEITAVFVNDETIVEATGTTTIVDIIKDTTNNTLSFVSMSTVPEGCTINLAGVIATTNASIGNSGDGFNADTATYARGRSWSGNSYRYSWTKGHINAGDTWYVRAYLVYTDADENVHTVYGDMVSVTF